MTADAMVAALERHYTGGPGNRDEDAYATYAELTHPSGRRCDYVAVGLWESRGVQIDAHEIKVSRADWLHELAQPTKAEAWWPNCHRWWLVVPDPSLVHDGELPDGWGLMVPGKSRRMKVITKPVTRQIAPPMWLTAAMLKRDRRLLVNATTQARYEGERKGAEQARQQYENRPGQPITSEQRGRLATLDELEQLLGCRVEKYGLNGQPNPQEVAAALQVARAMREVGGRYADNIAKVAEQAAATATAAEQLRTVHARMRAELQRAAQAGAA